MVMMTSTRYAPRSKGWYNQKRKKAKKAYNKLANRSQYASSNMRTGGYAGKELKHLDFRITSSVFPDITKAMIDGGTLSGIGQGTAEGQRMGNRAVIKSIMIRGTITTLQRSTNGAFKLWLVLDTQTNGAAMTPTEYLEDEGVATHALHAVNNLENSHRFRTLATKVVKYQPPTVWDDVGSSYAQINYVVPFTMAHTFKGGLVKRFLNTGATISGEADYSIHLLAVSAGDNKATSQATVAYTSRIRFYGD